MAYALETGSTAYIFCGGFDISKEVVVKLAGVGVFVPLSLWQISGTRFDFAGRWREA